MNNPPREDGTQMKVKEKLQRAVYIGGIALLTGASLIVMLLFAPKSRKERKDFRAARALDRLKYEETQAGYNTLSVNA